MSSPSNMAIASAIVEAVESQVIAEWQYLDAYRSLTAAGMLHEDACYALEVEPRDTIPMSKIAEWERYGSRGLLVFCGAKDSGKSYAAARWVVRRHEAGEPTLWIRASSFGGMTLDDMRDLMRRAARADALVFDDAGAGTMGHGDYFASMLEGLLLERGQRPTIVSGNMNQAEMAKWLGPRVTSRQRQAGGFVELKREAGLRQRTVDELGACMADMTRRVETIGCERTRVWVETPEFKAYLRDVKPDAWYPWPDGEPEGHYVDSWLVGQPLMEAAAKGTREIRRASDEFGLDRAAIRTRASELDGETASKSMTIDQRIKHQQIRMKLAAIEDNRRRAKVCYDALYKRPTNENAPASTGATPS